MAERAHVDSIDAVADFRAALLIYLSKARPVLDDACAEVGHTREWMRGERRLFWEAELRKRRKQFEYAEQALFSARMTNLRDATSAEIMAVQRAKRAVSEAEEKLKTLKKWTRDLETHVEPLVKQLEHLRTVLSNDMPKAALRLVEVIKLLDAYANLLSAPRPEASPQAVEETNS